MTSRPEANRPTRGPWRVGHSSGYGQLNGVAVTDGNHGLTLAVAIGDVPELNSAANARLIAAAPDLLAALTDALWVINNMSALMPNGLASTLEDPRPKIIAAITKATGEESNGSSK